MSNYNIREPAQTARERLRKRAYQTDITTWFKEKTLTSLSSPLSAPVNAAEGFFQN